MFFLVYYMKSNSNSSNSLFCAMKLKRPPDTNISDVGEKLLCFIN